MIASNGARRCRDQALAVCLGTPTRLQHTDGASPAATASEAVAARLRLRETV